MTLVYLNGEFLDPGEAKLSAFDASVQHGVGLFETMLAVGPEPRVHRLAEHLLRLKASAQELDLTARLETEPLFELIEESVRRSGLVEGGNRARVRVTLTGGDLNLREAGAAQHRPGVMVVVQPATVYPPEMFDRGVRIAIADFKANPLDPMAGHKTINYWARLRELQKASGKGAAEALIFTVSNHLAGGCVSNALAVRDGKLLTPIARGEEQPGAIPSPVLPGITRAAVIEFAHDLGLEIERRMVSIDDVLEAEELFCTNSSWGLLPVVAVEGRQIGAGAPGPLAAAVGERWRRELA